MRRKDYSRPLGEAGKARPNWQLQGILGALALALGIFIGKQP